MNIKQLQRDMWTLTMRQNLSKKERKTLKGISYLYHNQLREKLELYKELYQDKKMHKPFMEWFEDRYIFETGTGVGRNSDKYSTNAW